MFSRKLRDEYDKLEGALRKLGVDPETVVSGAAIGLRSAPVALADEEDDDFADDDEEEEDEYAELGGGTLRRRPPRAALEPLTLEYADDAEADESGSSFEQSHHHQQQNRHRHLDILEEVGKHEHAPPCHRLRHRHTKNVFRRLLPLTVPPAK